MSLTVQSGILDFLQFDSPITFFGGMLTPPASTLPSCPAGMFLDVFENGLSECVLWARLLGRFLNSLTAFCGLLGHVSGVPITLFLPPLGSADAQGVQTLLLQTQNPQFASLSPRPKVGNLLC